MIYVAGVDIGSVFSKVTISSGEFKAYHIMFSGRNYKSTADQAMKKVLAKASLSSNDIIYVVATGYGASNVSFANETITEISCQAKGVSYLFPSVRTAIDIGGQFTRVFKVDDRGRAIAFVLSEKCASGSGRLLQVIARILQMDFMEIGPQSFKSQERVDFNTGCAVFAESEAISRIAEGTSKEDILAGIHRAMAAKTLNLAERVGLTPDCALLGGGAKDIGLVKSIEDILELSILVPEEPQSVTSLGAALIAGEKASLLELVNLKESNNRGN
jgi:predicted CoA-substrate-specific enzyme activase